VYPKREELKCKVECKAVKVQLLQHVEEGEDNIIKT
jgi:hypothetical protein